MSVLLDDPDLLELTVNRPEIEGERLDNDWWTITGQDPMGDYYKVAVDTATYLEICDSLEHEWSIDIIVPRFQIWGRP